MDLDDEFDEELVEEEEEEEEEEFDEQQEENEEKYVEGQEKVVEEKEEVYYVEKKEVVDQVQKEDEEIMKITIERSTKVTTYEKQVEFQLKIEKNKIPNGYQKVNSVSLMLKIQGEKNFSEIKMSSKVESNFNIVYNCVLEIQTNKQYQYCYKVNSEAEKEYRSYRFNNDFEIKVDEWNKIWIGYHFKVPKQLISFLIQQNKEFPSEIFESFPSIFENYQLITNLTKYQYFTEIYKKLLYEWDQIEFIQRSNCKIIQFSFESYFLNENNKQQNQNKQMNFQDDIYGLNKEIKLLENKFNHHQQIYSNYTNNLNTILEDLTLNNSQVSNEQIQHLLTPIKIPIIPDDPAFEKCKSNLIIINNKLDDIKNNNIRIQDQYDALKIEYEQGIQQLSDYEKISVKKNDINQHQIQKLKQELDLKKQDIENFKKEQDQKIIQFRIRIIEAKRKYHEEIKQKEQELIDLIGTQKVEKQLILDTNQKIKLLEIETLRLKTLLKEKDTYVINQSDYVTALLKQIQNYKQLLNVQSSKRSL